VYETCPSSKRPSDSVLQATARLSLDYMSQWYEHWSGLMAAFDVADYE